MEPRGATSASPPAAAPAPTLSSDLMAFLARDREDDAAVLVDVRLAGTDGVRVPAFRTVLAARSDVLRRMLLGDFAESRSDEVAMDYPGEVLRAVVEHCVTDDFAQFDDGDADEAAARGIVQLVACAHFLNLPVLEEKARARALKIAKAAKSLACCIYDEASCHGDPTSAVKLEALSIIRCHPEDALLREPGVSCARPEVLGELTSDGEMSCEEITLFRALAKWAKERDESDSLASGEAVDATEVARGILAERDDIDSSLASGQTEDAAEVARGMIAEHIDLASIRPTDLVGVVRTSGLVDERAVAAALEAHALNAERRPDHRFSRRRKASSSASGAEHAVECVEECEKMEHLVRHLMTVQEGLILVFAKRPDDCVRIEDELCGRGFPTCSVHCQKSPRDREDALRAFGSESCLILVAEGDGAYLKKLGNADIRGITQVINYHLPSDIADYVHRTGLMKGPTGNKAVSFVNGRDSGVAKELEELLEKCGQEVPRWLKQMSR